MAESVGLRRRNQNWGDTESRGDRPAGNQTRAGRGPSKKKPGSEPRERHARRPGLLPFPFPLLFQF